MALGDVEDAGTLVSGGRNSNFQFANDKVILTDGKMNYKSKSVHFIHLAPDLV